MGKGLEGDAVAVLAAAQPHRQTSHPIAGGNDVAVILENQDRGRALDQLLDKADAGGEIVAQANQRADELGGVHRAAGHGVEMTALL